jgi:hypothetical protein
MQKLIEHALSDTYKLFNAIQLLSGTMPYQQFPAQLVWSQRRMPPMLRLTRGLARVVVVVRRRVARRKDSMVGLLGGFVVVDGLGGLDGCWFGGCDVFVLTTGIFPVTSRCLRLDVAVASLIIESGVLFWLGEVEGVNRGRSKRSL